MLFELLRKLESLRPLPKAAVLIGITAVSFLVTGAVSLALAPKVHQGITHFPPPPLEGAVPNEVVGELSARPQPKPPQHRQPVNNKHRHKPDTEIIAPPLTTGRQLGLLEGTDLDPIFHPADL